MTHRTHPRLILRKERARSVLRFHPWVFSGAVSRIEGDPKEGDVVEVLSSDGRLLALGDFGEGSISARIFSFHEVVPDRPFWAERFEKAHGVRRALGLTENPSTTAYRLINAEGDGMPGLIVDIYGDSAVVQFHSLGMFRRAKMFSEIIREMYEGRIRRVVEKRGAAFGEEKGVGASPTEEHFPFSTLIRENDCLFEVDLLEGQKTGFFLDQRENRKLLRTLSGGRTVLDAFAYSGGFSVYALAGGAREVVSVESSRPAASWIGKNVDLNFQAPPHHVVTADCFRFLKEMERHYDLIVLDPPAFAKHRGDLKRALKGYTTVNTFALKRIRKGGILFTFSCSQFVDRDLLQKVLFSAAAESGREVRILYRLGQGPDHPVSLYHPEGEYLKGLVLQVL